MNPAQTSNSLRVPSLYRLFLELSQLSSYCFGHRIYLCLSLSVEKVFEIVSMSVLMFKTENNTYQDNKIKNLQMGWKRNDLKTLNDKSHT